MLHNIRNISQESSSKSVYKRREIPPVTMDVFTSSFIYYVIKNKNPNIKIQIHIDSSDEFIPNPNLIPRSEYLVVVSPAKSRLNKDRVRLEYFNVKVWATNPKQLTNAVDFLISLLSEHGKKIATTYQDVNDVNKKNNLHYVNISGYFTTLVYNHEDKDKQVKSA